MNPAVVACFRCNSRRLDHDVDPGPVRWSDHRKGESIGECTIKSVAAAAFARETLLRIGRPRDDVSLQGKRIVLAHEAFGDLCRWVPYGNLLSRYGFRVLVFDYRDVGLSAKVTGKRAARIDADIAGAIAELRRRGPKEIVLVGASLGGAAVLAAAASARPALAGVVSISGPDSAFLRGGGYEHAVLDPTTAAARMRSPLLFLASKDDPSVPAASTGKLYRAATIEDKRLVVVPGSSHGISIVDDRGATGTKVRNLILEFIRDRTGS
jgi:pimeloyl-ACP methyl ester carboxylesterase